MAIEFGGEFVVDAPRERVFAILSDPEKFAPLLPTYQSLEVLDDGSAQIKVKVNVGKVRGTATVNLALEESEAPSRAAYDAKGKIMGAAFNFGSAFELETTNGGTRVKWRGDLSMFGKLVSLAGGLIRPIATKHIESLIDAIQMAMSSSKETST